MHNDGCHRKPFAALLQYLAREYKVLRGVKNTVPEVADATPHKQAVPDLQVP